jgi:general secretion pathway protein A
MIDEAQHLSPQVLEEIRVISNMETNHSKLLQIVLVGQLNLLDLLAAPELRQLNQRVSLRATLTPLARADVEAYVGHRLSVARGSSAVTFDAQALDAIQAASEGVPRVINLLCDRSLMLGARYGIGVITADIVSEAAHALGLRTPRARIWPWRTWPWMQDARRWVPIAAAILALLIALVALTRALT